MAKFDWISVIKVNLVGFKIVGLWPRGNGYRINLYSLHALVTTFFLGFVLSSCQTWKLITNLNDIEVVTETAFLSMSDSMVVVKIIYLVLNMKDLKKLMKTLKSQLFQPRNHEQIALVAPDLKMWKIMYNVLAASISGAIVFWAMLPILTNSIEQHRLPFVSWYPYNTTKTPFYEITYVHQILSVLFLAYVNVNMDTFIAAFSLFAGAQFDILCDDLKNIEASEFRSKLEVCVRHHREIISFVKTYNKAFSWIIFIQFFISATAIGLTMFLLTTVAPFSGEFCSFLFYANAVSLEIFIYCWYGNELQIKSSKVFVTAFESQWIEACSEAKYELIFFMAQTQKEMRVLALNLFDLSLQNFLKILKTAYSYFALISRLSSEK